MHCHHPVLPQLPREQAPAEAVAHGAEEPLRVRCGELRQAGAGRMGLVISTANEVGTRPQLSRIASSSTAVLQRSVVVRMQVATGRRKKMKRAARLEVAGGDLQVVVRRQEENHLALLLMEAQQTKQTPNRTRAAAGWFSSNLTRICQCRRSVEPERGQAGGRPRAAARLQNAGARRHGPVRLEAAVLLRQRLQRHQE